MPGSGDHCFGDMSEISPPPKPATLGEVFTRISFQQSGNNCGDLCFSGHMFFCCLWVILIIYYSNLVLRLPFILQGLFLFFTVTIGASQGIFIISARNHYTIDVVVACYVTPLLFYWHSNYWCPKDLCTCTKSYIDYRELEETFKLRSRG